MTAHRRRALGSRLRAAALVLLLAAAAAPPGADAQASAGPAPLQWWGPTTQGTGHHLRLPVTVTNDKPFSVSNAPAVAELDLGAALREAGWVTAPSGDRDVLESFRLDLDSVRVVAMTNLDPPVPGTPNGQPRAVDLSLPASDLRRYEVPSLAIPGFLDRVQEAPYNERTNPVVSVLWMVPGVLRSQESRHFMVYFDTTMNRDHEPTSHVGRPGWAQLTSLFGPGAGLELVTFPTVTAGGSQVTVVALNPATTVRVYAATVGGQWRAVVPPSGFPPNPATLAANQPTVLYAGVGSTAMVRIVADKPVLGYGVGTGFVPSLDSGWAGRSFLFAKTLTVAADETVHFMTTGTQPTTVVVQPVPPDGTTLTFTLNDAANPYPYTTGDRAFGFTGPNASPACVPVQTSTSLAAPGLYTATVTEGEPVFLQHAPAYGMSQVPASDGTAFGSAFQAATSLTNFRFFTNSQGTPTCGPSHRIGTWMAASPDAPLAMRVTNAQAPAQVDPPGTPGNPQPPGRTIPAEPLASARYQAAFRDRPLAFLAEGGEAAVYTGLLAPLGQPAPTRVPVLHGPLLGEDAGRTFAGMGPTVVYAPYAGTRVTARMEASGSGVVTQTVTLPAGGVHAFDDLAANDWVNGVRIAADKPVIAYPRNVAATMAAMPAFLKTTLGQAEFRGHLVRIASATGLDPVTASTTAGGQVTYTFEVTNLGRGVGGASLADTIELSLSPDPAGWTAQLSPQVLGPLASGETREVHLTVRPLAGAAPGSLGVYTVQATSRGNPAMGDAVGTVTYLQRSYDVGLWFGSDPRATSGGKTLTRPAEPAGTNFPLMLYNKGSVTDVIRVTATAPSEGWSVRVLRNGADVGDLTLSAEERVPLQLRVVPPPGAADGLLVTTVTADSLSSPAIDRVTATTRLRSASALDLVVPKEELRVRPGDEAVFGLSLRNGGGPTEVALAATADALPGWSAPGIHFADPRTGARIPLARYSIGSNEALPIGLNVTAPATASAGDVVGIRFAAQSREGADGVEAFLYAIVEAVHALKATTVGTGPVAAEADGTTGIRLRVANGGNLNESLAWRTRVAPPGWSLEGPPSLLVPRGATQELRLNLTSPRDAANGLYNVTLDLVSKDGNVTVVTLRVAVGDVPLVAVEAPDAPLAAQPGRPARILLPVANEGNLALGIEVQPHPAEAWTLRGTPEERTFLLEPGARLQVPVAWDVPAGAARGAATHLARLAVSSAGAAPDLQDVAVTVDVGRPDLDVALAQARRGPAGTLVQATVRNEGDRPAQDFVVRLLAGSRVVEEVPVDELLPGRTASLHLLAPVGSSGELALMVDATGAVVEADEADNAASVADRRAAGEQAAGAPLAAAAMASLAAAWLAGRRRR